MKKPKKSFGIVLLAAILAFSFAACSGPTDSEPGGDNSQFLGTWTGNVSSIHPELGTIILGYKLVIDETGFTGQLMPQNYIVPGTRTYAVSGNNITFYINGGKVGEGTLSNGTLTFTDVTSGATGVLTKDSGSGTVNPSLDSGLVGKWYSTAAEAAKTNGMHVFEITTSGELILANDAQVTGTTSVTTSGGKITANLTTNGVTLAQTADYVISNGTKLQFSNLSPGPGVLLTLKSGLDFAQQIGGDGYYHKGTAGSGGEWGQWSNVGSVTGYLTTAQIESGSNVVVVDSSGNPITLNANYEYQLQKQERTHSGTGAKDTRWVKFAERVSVWGAWSNAGSVTGYLTKTQIESGGYSPIVDSNGNPVTLNANYEYQLQKQVRTNSGTGATETRWVKTVERVSTGGGTAKTLRITMPVAIYQQAGGGFDLGIFPRGTTLQDLETIEPVAGTGSSFPGISHTGTTTITLTAPLYIDEDATPWTGSGSYDIYAILYESGSYNRRVYRVLNVSINSATTPINVTSANEVSLGGSGPGGPVTTNVLTITMPYSIFEQGRDGYMIGVFPQGTTLQEAFADNALPIASGADGDYSGTTTITLTVPLYAGTGEDGTPWTTNGTFDVFAALYSASAGAHFYKVYPVTFSAGRASINVNSSNEVGPGSNPGGGGTDNPGGGTGTDTDAKTLVITVPNTYTAYMTTYTVMLFPDGTSLNDPVSLISNPNLTAVASATYGVPGVSAVPSGSNTILTLPLRNNAGTLWKGSGPYETLLMLYSTSGTGVRYFVNTNLSFDTATTSLNITDFTEVTISVPGYQLF